MKDMKDDSTAFKSDAGKPQWTLLTRGTPFALEAVVRILTYAVTAIEDGGKGHIPHSWKRVPAAKRRYEDALLRHLSAISKGEVTDPETGELHFAHVAVNALFLTELTELEFMVKTDTKECIG